MENNLQKTTCSFLRLFKKLPTHFYDESDDFEVFEEYGVFTYKLHENYLGVVKTAIKETLPEASQFNDTFWKSFSNVVDKSQEELWTHAIIHYFSTYGLEQLGLDDKNFVYLPQQITKDIPQLEKFFFIDEIENQDAIDQIFKILNMNTGIKIQTIDDCLQILDYYQFTIQREDIEKLTNKEARAYIYFKKFIRPSSAKEIMSVLNYCILSDTNFVKNNLTLLEWKFYANYATDSRMNYIRGIIKDEAEIGDELAKSWFRYKDYLLQLKKLDDETASYINKISRRAKSGEWKPYNKVDFLTTRIFNDYYYDDKHNNLSSLYRELLDLDVFTLAKIYNKVNYVLNSTSGTPDIFTLRNGKYYLKEFATPALKRPAILDEICQTIKRTIKAKYGDILVKFPEENLDLAFPTSEKRFIGDIPYNTIVNFKEASVMGISWKNQGNQRVDLDLSMINEKNESFGWYSDYYNKNLSFIYSGDMTTEGAETFYINNPETKALLFVNSFNVKESDFDFFVSKEEIDYWKKSGARTMNPNNVIFSAKLHVERESVIGLYTQNKFIFTNFSGSISNISSAPKILLDNLSVVENKAKYSLRLKDIFEDVDEVYDEFMSSMEYSDLPVDEREQLFEEKYELVDLSELNKSEILKLVNNTI